MIQDVTIVNVRGHYEVFHDGEFCFSADTREEAMSEIKELVESDTVVYSS